MFQQEKIDPSVLEDEKDEESISIGDYIFYDKD
jgi:tRNA G37 N-methylase TrmD